MVGIAASSIGVLGAGLQRRLRLTRRYGACGAAFLLLLAAGSWAQAPSKEPQCGGVTGDPALAIQVCTRLIEFGSLERPDLAKAYYTRGTEWANQGSHDRALADYDLALELDPTLAP